MIKMLMTMALCLSLSGCLLTVDSDNKSTRQAWYETDLEHIQPGHSNSDEVLALLGTPTSKVSHPDGMEVWGYRNRSEKDTKVGLFLVLSIDVERKQIETLFVKFRNDIVSSYWIEESRF